MRIIGLEFCIFVVTLFSCNYVNKWWILEKSDLSTWHSIFYYTTSSSDLICIIRLVFCTFHFETKWGTISETFGFFICFSPVISKLVPAGIPNVQYHIQFTQEGKEEKDSSSLIDYKFTSHDIVCLVFCSLIGLWYLFKKVRLRESSHLSP
jgi:hypothetical protein